MGRLRIGVAFRVLAALLLIVGLTAGLGGYALHTFGALRGDVRDLAEDRLPTILAAARLDRQAALLSAQAAALVLADSEGRRETEMMRILDLVATLERLIEDLAAGTSADADVEAIRTLKSGFVQTLDRLNTLVAQRNALRESLSRELLAVLDHGTLPDHRVVGISGQTAAWHLGVIELLDDLQMAGASEHVSMLTRRETLLRDGLARQSAAVAALPPDDRARAEALLARLRHWVEADEGIVAMRRSLLQIDDAIDGTLGRNRSLADLLGAASGSLFFAGEADARAAAGAATDRFGSSQITYAAVLACTALVILLTFLYLRESVILRLRRLQEAMAAHIAGRSAPIPTEGLDEIADMGRNLRFFLGEIARREAELRESEQLFRMLALTAPFPLLMVRLSDGTILRHNRRASEYLGLPDRESGVQVEELLPDPEDAAALVAARETPLTDREVKVRALDGRRGWALLSAAPATLRGQPVMLAGLVDIAARRQAEQAVRESEQKYRSLVENLKNHAVFAHDMDGRFTYMSPSVKDVLGHPPEVIARNFVALMPPEERARAEERQRELRQGQPFTRSYETLYLQPDGGTRTIAVVEATVVDDTGRVIGVEGVAHDVTAQRTYEAHLQTLVRELEQSNAELAHFAYIASHDLREPLRMITSYLGLLERRHGPALDPEAREFMGYAAEGARRMDRLILDLLEYSRVGRRDQTPGPVDLGATLQTVLASLSVALGEAGAAVEAVSALPVIDGDRTDLERLLQNLVGNAIKYRHPDRPPRIVVSAAEDGDHWRITVRDNGIGLPADQTERIFKIFQRLHPRSRYDGTGIGLAVCRKVAESHGGRIWAEPNPDGVGASFHILLPAARRAAA